MLFRKHYLDVVTPDDRVRILYIIELGIAGLAVRCAGALRSDTGAVVSTTTLLDVHEPLRNGDTLSWSSASLGVSCRIERTLRGPAVDLLPSGGLRWDCHTLRGAVTLDDTGETLVGSGYAETIEGNLPPWDYPWDTLAWGRVHEGDDAFVWTVLGGGNADRHVFARGAEVEAAGAIPPLETIRELRKGRIGETILSALPFAEKLPGRILGLSETKLLGRTPSGGRAIFESVRFPRRERR